jgi:hypothetical protein
MTFTGSELCGTTVYCGIRKCVIVAKCNNISDISVLEGISPRGNLVGGACVYGSIAPVSFVGAECGNCCKFGWHYQ